MIFKLVVVLLIVNVLLYFKMSGFKIPSRRKDQLFLMLTSAVAVFFVLCLIIFPEESYRAAVDGVQTWINVVLPALLPFFIGAEIMMGLGIIDFIGVMLEPFMRPLFKTPGISSFVYIMSITSGYPVGVKLTCDLVRQGRCTTAEGQRMLSFCSTSGPLFMIGAVSIGMLGSARAGTVIALSHYAASIILGMAFGFVYRGRSSAGAAVWRLPSIKNGLRAMYKRRIGDGRPIGQLLGDAVREGFNTMLMVGGFIIMFSVVIEICRLSGLMRYISGLLTGPFRLISAPEPLIEPVLSGMVEITIGSRMIGSIQSVPMLHKIIATSFIIGWSGLCIQAQALSFISKTELSGRLYIVSKLCHGLLCGIISFPLGRLLLSGRLQPTFLPALEAFGPAGFWQNLISSIQYFMVVVLVTLLLMLVCRLVASIAGLKAKKS
jgi:sporulation integral membrane protein YlbJ